MWRGEGGGALAGLKRHEVEVHACAAVHALHHPVVRAVRRAPAARARPVRAVPHHAHVAVREALGGAWQKAESAVLNAPSAVLLVTAYPARQNRVHAPYACAHRIKCSVTRARQEAR